MKKIYRIILVMQLLIMAAAGSQAQDTLTRPFISVTAYPSDIAFFYPNFDSTLLNPISGVHASNSTSHALYVNPNDGLLYAVLDSSNYTTRAIYKVNPFTGVKTLVYDLAEKFASVEVAPDGRIFGIHGNGTSTPGALYEIDAINQTQTFRMNVPVPANEPRTLGFNPTDGNIYVFSSFIDSVFVIDTANWTSQKLYSIQNGWEVHGIYFENDTFFLSSYGGQIQYIPLNNGLDATVINNSGNESYMDLTRFRMINGSTAVSFCSNSSTMLTARYESNSYTWYLNGMPIANSNNDTLVVNQAGTYMLLSQIGTSADHVFSEEITVTMLNAPLVSITGTATTYCPGDSIQLVATSGGTGQWYLNGNPIASATSSNYIATAAGNYNYIKTNQNGCADSSATGFVITNDPNCNPTSVLSIAGAESMKLYPNPASGEFTFETSVATAYIQVCDLNGKVVMSVNVQGQRSTVNAAGLAHGIYIVKAMGANDEPLAMKKLTIIK